MIGTVLIRTMCWSKPLYDFIHLHSAHVFAQAHTSIIHDIETLFLTTPSKKFRFWHFVYLCVLFWGDFIFRGSGHHSKKQKFKFTTSRLLQLPDLRSWLFFLAPRSAFPVGSWRPDPKDARSWISFSFLGVYVHVQILLAILRPYCPAAL